MREHISENTRLTQDGAEWIVILERTLEHPREEVWAALTEAEEIPGWGPFTTDRNLTSVGPIRLQYINVPEAEEAHGYVLEVSVPNLLVFKWGDDILRWELSGDGDKTFLVLRHRFADRQQAPSYAAGWHLCLDGLEGVLAGKNMPSMVGHNANDFGWRELHARYAEHLGVSLPAEEREAADE